MKDCEFLSGLFYKTAWTMTPPQPFSAFHLGLTASGVAFSVFLAYQASQLCRKYDSPGRPLRHPCSDFILFICGLVLVCMELYKQGFLYFVVNGQTYDWWYFPFQLCSIPMYLCLLYPWIESAAIRRVLATFLQDFGLLGGVMALAVPPGLLYPYWTLTLHGFFWHFLLIFSGLFCAMSGISDRSPSGYIRVLLLFFPCCLTALFINTAAGPGANADMFYISPYHPSSQPVFHEISMALGIFPGILIYLGCMVFCGFLIHCITAAFFSGRSRMKPRQKPAL